MVPVVAHVGGLQEEGNAADLVLGKTDSQGLEAAEESREHTLDSGDGAVTAYRAEAAHLIDEILSKFVHVLVGFLRIFEKRAFAFAHAIEIDVNADRHAQF